MSKQLEAGADLNLLQCRVRTVAFVMLAAATPSVAAELHYAPMENLERIDVEKLNTARKTIDIAAFVLTDWPIIQALIAAAYRGVTVRVYLDGVQAGQGNMSPDSLFGKLLTSPHVTVKQKHPGKPIMHLKSYCVDGQLFRTGSANFSASGLKQQDNDLLLFDDPQMCSDFTINFDQIWEGKDAE